MNGARELKGCLGVVIYSICAVLLSYFLARVGILLYQYTGPKFTFAFLACAFIVSAIVWYRRMRR